ncbi:MAG: hypothetical protein IKQ06_06175 [Bacilli bacterium]|nr:hypothetical protein [Bacilli bacterium]MBR6137724.1 hypothetical protein [Bacilli bacterium]
MIEIKIDKQNINKTKYYYDYLMIAKNSKIILKKRNYKVKKYSEFILSIGVYFLSLIFLLGIMLYVGFTSYLLTFFWILLIIFITLIRAEINFKKTIKSMLPYKRTIIIDKDGVTSHLEGRSDLTVNWSQIAFIFETELTLAFIMKDASQPIGVAIEYKDEILSAISKVKPGGIINN